MVDPYRQAIAVIGECMIELSEDEGGRMRRSFGGDTLNTALYLARLGNAVDYVTALGNDPYSDELIHAWEAEGIGTAFVLRKDGAVPGLYLIRTSPEGEREFHYWRDAAPVRDMIRDGHLDRFAPHLGSYRALYLSGITLALFDEAQRERLFRFMETAAAQGMTIAFDPNHRPRLWSSKTDARRANERAASLCHILLPGMEDCAVLWPDEEVAALSERLRAMGPEIVVLKDGSRPVHVLDSNGHREIPVNEEVRPRDTSAAGDSFNAGFLDAYMRREADACRVERAVAAGARLAATVIAHPGAIIPNDAMPAPFGSFSTE